MRADVRVEIAGGHEYVDVLESLVTDYAAARGLSMDQALDLGLAVRESLTNAIQHGTRSGQPGRVRLELGRGDGSLVVRVRDAGPGFDPGALPDPLHPANLARGSGRGIFFMRRFTDRVSFSFPRRGGTVVCLIKCLARSLRGARGGRLSCSSRPATPRAPER